MYDPEVVAELRRQFQAADTDNSGEIDAQEACAVFARSCGDGASEEEVQKTAERLRHQLDTDRSGTISFNEYCFRFGRGYQIEHNRRRRNGGGAATVDPAAESEKLKKEREELEKEREAIRQERERLMLEREREALRQEREQLERERQASGAGTASSSGAHHAEGARAQVLAVGSWVRIQGLQSAPELNGREAKIVSFDQALMRYVVELREGGLKKIKESNLAAVAADASTWFQRCTSMAERAGRSLKHGCAKAQVWLAESGYEWWQILLGVAVVVLVVVSWMQASSRYRSKAPGASAGGAGRSRPTRSSYRDDYDDYSYREDYSSSYWDDGGGGWSFDFGGMQKYLLLGGLAFLCWKGIIPVHRMDWFQLYMLWNMIQSTGILGGGGGHYGYGRRRRMFF